MRVPLKLVMVGVPLIAVLLTASVFGVLSYRFASASLERSIAARLAAAATARRDAVVQRHEFWHRRAETLAGNADLVEWARLAGTDPANAAAPLVLAQAAAPHQREVVAAVVLSRRGQSLFASAQHGVEVEPWISAINVRRIRKITDLGARRTAFGSAAGVVVPIGRGRIVGFLLVLFNMDGVFAVTRDYTGLGETGETMIARVEGRDSLRHISPTRFRRDAALAPVTSETPRLSPEAADGDGRDEPVEPGDGAAALLELVSSGDVGVLIDYRGEASFAVARHIGGVDWIVIAKIDVEEAYGSLRRLLAAFGIAGLVVVALIAVLSIAFCAYALRQTRALKDAAQQLGTGNYTAEAPSGRVTELNALAHAFNRMRDGVLSALEGERAARKAANAASEAKSRFLATMSHEIRTPMNGVIGAADLLSCTKQDGNQRLLTKTIVESGTALLGLINDILDFSRLEARNDNLAREPFCPRDTIESVAAMAARIADDKPLPVVVDIDQSADALLVGDEGRLRQILVNLVGNALKFTQSGHVLVTAASTESGLLSIAVEDTGPGIPPDRLSTIFEAFEQVDNSMTRAFEGTGLGLAISRRLARAMGGDIEVHSMLGEGSTFTFYAPMPRAAVQEKRPQPQLDGLSVAILEPLAPAADSIRRILSRAGARVLDGDAAPSAEVAIVADLETARSVTRRMPAAAVVLHGVLGAEAIAAEQSGTLAAVLPRPAPARSVIEAVANAHHGSASAPPVSKGGTGNGALAGLRLLVAEDNRVNRMIVERMLTQNGASVTLCENGALALEQIRAVQPDLVLLDVSMPVMDGLQALAAIRALPGERGMTPVIMLTAHDDLEIRESAGAADGYLTKPSREQGLVEGILAAVARRRGTAQPSSSNALGTPPPTERTTQ